MAAFVVFTFGFFRFSSHIQVFLRKNWTDKFESTKLSFGPVDFYKLFGF